MMNSKLTSRAGGLTSRPSGGGGGLLKTRQTTAYHVGDDGDLEPGLPTSYTVLTTGQFSGTTTVDTPHYANNGISFVAPSTINDAGAGLVTFLATDTIRVRGSALNDGVYTVAVGAVAGSIVVNEVTIVNEGAARYITLCKRSTPSNEVVLDNVTGLMWRRYSTGRVGAVERVGNTSAGLLIWYDTATCFTLHPAGADLQMMTTGIKIVGGAGEAARYFVGMSIDPSGFANAVNNLPGYRIAAVTVNGADLDLTIWTGKNTLIAEAAAGARDIRVVCRSIFAYCAAVNAINFAGFTDWRIENVTEMISLANFEPPDAFPDAAVFPNWAWADYFWTSTVAPANTTQAIRVEENAFACNPVAKTNPYYCILVRGGA